MDDEKKQAVKLKRQQKKLEKEKKAKEEQLKYAEERKKEEELKMKAKNELIKNNNNKFDKNKYVIEYDVYQDTSYSIPDDDNNSLYEPEYIKAEIFIEKRFIEVPDYISKNDVNKIGILSKEACLLLKTYDDLKEYYDAKNIKIARTLF